MTVEHHDLIHEFPEHKETIHELKIGNAHFRNLFDAYHEKTTEVENMENEVMTVASMVEEKAKKQRLKLKDELYAMILKYGPVATS